MSRWISQEAERLAPLHPRRAAPGSAVCKAEPPMRAPSPRRQGSQGHQPGGDPETEPVLRPHLCRADGGHRQAL